jgi:hypothetical protein
MRATLVVLACALPACGLEPDVGPLVAGTCDNADTNPEVSVSFSQQIRPVLNRVPTPTQPDPGCSCHLPTAGGPGIGILASGLNLGSLSSLRAGGRTSGSAIVIAGDPCGSMLYQKVDGAPPFGSRMPLGGPPFLNQQDLALLHDWIAEGALDN